jgi:hypothetical protein
MTVQITQQGVGREGHLSLYGMLSLWVATPLITRRWVGLGAGPQPPRKYKGGCRGRSPPSKILSHIGIVPVGFAFQHHMKPFLIRPRLMELL